MSMTIIIALVLLFVLVMGGLVFYLIKMDSAASGQGSQISKMVSAQRHQDDKKEVKEEIFQEFQKSRIKRESSAKLTLEKKLRYGRLKMPPVVFRLLQVFISITAVFLLSIKCHPTFSIVFGGAIGPVFMNWVLTTLIDNRAKKFDRDFPSYLLSLVSLIKTGQNTMTAIEAAARGLDPTSSVREEVFLMIERLRLGVPEEQSIGSFAEDIMYTETELFVQALLLSRRVGGTLSDTLERLAKQARRRQHFRESAQSAVGMQRGSIWFILGVMVFLEAWLYWAMPEAVIKSIQHPMGWVAWQVGAGVILSGLYWVRQITKLKI